MNQNRVLQPHQTFTVGPLTKRFDPCEYFVTCEGLCVHMDDDARVLFALARPIGAAPAATMRSFNLTENVYDRGIKAELPVQYEVSEALWEIASLIDAQKDGKAGPLLVDGYANIFYALGFAVYVVWRSCRSGWDVVVYRRDDGHWHVRYRVFSRD